MPTGPLQPARSAIFGNLPHSPANTRGLMKHAGRDLPMAVRKTNRFREFSGGKRMCGVRFRKRGSDIYRYEDDEVIYRPKFHDYENSFL